MARRQLKRAVPAMYGQSFVRKAWQRHGPLPIPPPVPLPLHAATTRRTHMHNILRSACTMRNVFKRVQSYRTTCTAIRTIPHALDDPVVLMRLPFALHVLYIHSTYGIKQLARKPHALLQVAAPPVRQLASV